MESGTCIDLVSSDDDGSEEENAEVGAREDRVISSSKVNHNC